MVTNAILDEAEIAADQREQIGRLREWVVPDGKMAAVAGKVAGVNQVAVGEQHRRGGFLGLDAGGVDRHDIRAIGEIRNATEPFGLALGAVDRSGTIKPEQLGVGAKGPPRSRS